MQRRLRTLRRHLPSQRITLAEKIAKRAPRQMPERSLLACQRTSPLARFFCYHREKGGKVGKLEKEFSKRYRDGGCRCLSPQGSFIAQDRELMDYEWLYARLSPYYCADNGRPGTDPVVLIKMVLRQHLYGIPSLRQTYQRIQDTLSYRWFWDTVYWTRSLISQR